MLKRASDLLASGSVLGTILQPHYGHIPYGLQFMMDYNLQGMSLIHLKIAKFRHSNPTVTYRRDSQLGTPWEGFSQPATQRLFKIGTSFKKKSKSINVYGLKLNLYN